MTIAPLLPFPAPQDTLRLARALAADDPLRLRLEAACEALESLAARIIAKLDYLGPDPDLEDDELESNFGSPGRVWCDKLIPDEAEADDADDEPWLAAPEGVQSYASFICGGRHEFEDDDDGREPSLAAPEGAQTFDARRCGVSDEREGSYLGWNITLGGQQEVQDGDREFDYGDYG